MFLSTHVEYLGFIASVTQDAVKILCGRPEVVEILILFVSLLAQLALGLPCVFLAKTDFEAAASCSIPS
jgi:hypothetical protein